MHRILILLAGLLLVGCPQGSYQPQTSVAPDLVIMSNEQLFGWCVKSGRVWQRVESFCKEDGGEFFDSKRAAVSAAGKVLVLFRFYGGQSRYVDHTKRIVVCMDGELILTGLHWTYRVKREIDFIATKGTHSFVLAVSNESVPKCSKLDEIVWKETRTITRNVQIDVRMPDPVTASAPDSSVPPAKEQPEIAPTPTPTPEPTPEAKPESKPRYRLASTGTGFKVNKHYVVTAEHVLDGCKAVSIVHGHDEISAQPVSWDKNNDLGLLKVKERMVDTAKLRRSPDLRVGDAAINYGYPLFGQLSNSAKLSVGYVNSLAGYSNDSSIVQYSAPTQPGNSGGPVLDQSGNVIGVVSSGLSKRYAEESGHIAQNVNFAIKSTILEGFLKANKVSYEKADSTEELKLPDIAEKAETFTVLVGCWE